jgi:hypothetical protein
MAVSSCKPVRLSHNRHIFNVSQDLLSERQGYPPKTMFSLCRHPALKAITAGDGASF